MVRCCEIARLFGGNFGELDDRVDHRLEARVAVHNRAEHDFFRKLFGFRFNHQHSVGRAGDHKVEHRVGHFGERWVQAELALNIAHACGTNRTHERNAG